ncbi:MAG: FkbM family methyltransferase [Flavobacteriaceae bacterium]|nr:FkbM family methyltransferase [Flavobacteriaceae bacterium]
MTLAHKISTLIPKKIASYIRPYYHLFKIKITLFRRGINYYFDNNYGGWIILFPIVNKTPLKLICRSSKELKRISRFGLNKKDVVWKWLNWLEEESILFDVGSGSGFEGLTAGHLHNSKVVFIEPYTPSIETILKSIYLQKKRNNAKWEVVHAGCTDKDSYTRLGMHNIPNPGETLNTFGSDSNNYNDGGKTNRTNIVIQQWVKGVSLDSLVFKHKLAYPDFVKIDVDGHETSVINGASELLKSNHVKSWVIEITLESTINKITEIMKKNGYTPVEDTNHYPGYKIKTIDRVFIRNDYLSKWEVFSKEWEG